MGVSCGVHEPCSLLLLGQGGSQEAALGGADLCAQGKDVQRYQGWAHLGPQPILGVLTTHADARSCMLGKFTLRGRRVAAGDQCI